MNLERQRPFGRLRIYAQAGAAATTVIAPFWGRYLAAYPDVQLEVQTGYEAIDIVAKGFDAGISLPPVAAADMIALRVTGPMKVAVVGAPAYFARRPPPRTPDDLGQHSCVQYRFAEDGDVYKWPFKRNGKSRQISVDGRVIVNNLDLALRAAADGLGVAEYTLEARAEPLLRAGQLVRVLEDWSPCYEGLFLYYSGHQAYRPHYVPSSI